MRIALLGTGRMGRLHARLLAATRGVDELIVADAVPERAHEAAAEVGARAVDSQDAALDRANAVVIAANTDVHAELIRAAVRRGLPTFCEKPLALDLATSVDVATEIERSGVPFQLGFQRRFDPAYAEARRLVEEGDIGKLYLVRLIAHDAAPPPESYIPTSGGLFRDSAIHDFDAIRFVTGNEVEEVFATGSVRVSEVFDRYDDIDTAGAILTMTDGVVGVLSQTRHNPRGYDIRMELVGSGDAVSVGDGPRKPIRSLEPGAVPPDTGWESFLTRFEDAYAAELSAFVRVARGELDSPCTAHDGVEALRIAEAAARSLREHRPVTLAEIPADVEGLSDPEKEVLGARR